MINKNILLSLCFGALCTLSYAQESSLQLAQQAQRKFLELYQSQGDKLTMYQALIESYNEHLKVLNSAEVNSSAYAQAKAMLRGEVYPRIEAAAVFFQSQGMVNMTTTCAQIITDMPKHQAFKDETFNRSRNYPVFVWIAANEPFNQGDYRKAISYLQEYVDICPEQRRQNAYQLLARSYSALGERDNVLSVVDLALTSYPTDVSMLQIGVNTALALNDSRKVLDYATRLIPLEQNPVNLRLLQFNIGKAYEDQNDFQKAIDFFNMMRMDSETKQVYEHLAQNYYNLAALHYNRNVAEPNEHDAVFAEENFKLMLEIIQPLYDEDPLSRRYNVMKANAFSCLGRQEDLKFINDKLRAIGGQEVENEALPTMIAHVEQKEKSAIEDDGYSAEGLQSFIIQYVKQEIEPWMQKREFESLTEFNKRVNQKTIETEQQELIQEALQMYLKRHMRPIRVSDLDLRPYDKDNGTFLVVSKYGNFALPVPSENKEAELFKSGWERTKLDSIKYCIQDQRLTIEHVDFITPMGKTYKYDIRQSGQYQTYVIDLGYNLGSVMDKASVNARRDNVSTKTFIIGKSDVDSDVPETTMVNEKTYAFIVGNENYNHVSKVQFALDDANSVASYCQKTLGIPEGHIRVYRDATNMAMRHIIDDIREVASVNNNDIHVIFYYAGHGVPNEADRSAHLLPVDVRSSYIQECISVSDLYRDFNQLGVLSVTVFMDACFSGSTRGNDMLAAARGVVLRTNLSQPKGKIVAFSAATGDETAYPYNEKSHGMFTYFLLKKLKETAGDVTLGELGDYISANVKKVSLDVNQKLQTPTVSVDKAAGNSWRLQKLVQN